MRVQSDTHTTRTSHARLAVASQAELAVSDTYSFEAFRPEVGNMAVAAAFSLATAYLEDLGRNL